MTRHAGNRRALAYTILAMFALVTMVQWVTCCRRTETTIRPTTIPVLLDDPLTDDIDERIRKAEDE